MIIGDNKATARCDRAAMSIDIGIGDLAADDLDKRRRRLRPIAADRGKGRGT